MSQERFSRLPPGGQHFTKLCCVYTRQATDDYVERRHSCPRQPSTIKRHHHLKEMGSRLQQQVAENIMASYASHFTITSLTPGAWPLIFLLCFLPSISLYPFFFPSSFNSFFISDRIILFWENDRQTWKTLQQDKVIFFKYHAIKDVWGVEV